jgi:peroxiredoxin
LRPLLKYLSLSFFASVALHAGSPPPVGQKAADFTLASVRGKETKLSDIVAKGPTALVVLRGYPGYQCPFCQRQVQDYVQNAKAFAAAGIQVIFVYPGPPDNLNGKANEFLADKNFPDTFEMLLDPGYTFTNLYGLRWDARQETAYPSTFLLDQDGVVFYVQSARLHSGRTAAATVLGYYKELKPGKK